MKNIYCTIEGIFWTTSYERIQGKAISNGEYWYIVEATDKDEINQTYRDLWLDQSGNILAPRNNELRNCEEEKISEILRESKKELDKLKNDEEALRISGIQMKVRILENKIKEYKYLYDKYFISNSIRFILGL